MDYKSLQNNPYINKQDNTNSMGNNNDLLGKFDTQKFLLGALIGAAGAYLLTNENAQKNLFKAIAKGSELFQTGIEELKERFEDAKAELQAEEK